MPLSWLSSEMLEKPLFQNGDLRNLLDRLKNRVREKIEEADQAYMLSVDKEEWVEHLAAECQLTAPTLRTVDRYYEEIGEVEVNVQGAGDRIFRYGSTSTYVPGWAVEVHIPVDGTIDLLSSQPNLYGPTVPVAALHGHEVVKRYEWPTDRPPLSVDQEVENLERQINTYARKTAEEVETYNSELADIARDVITKRRERVLVEPSGSDAAHAARARGWGS